MANTSQGPLTRSKKGSISEKPPEGDDVFVSADSELISCFSCLNKFQKTSLNMEDSFFESLRTKKYPGVTWNCEACVEDQPSDNFSSFKDLISDLNITLQNDLGNKIKKEMSELNKTLHDRINELELDKKKELEVYNKMSRTMGKMTEPQVVEDKDKHTQHTILIKPDKDSETFTEKQWNTVVKKSIKSQLKNVPITKTVITKSGNGVLFFPNKHVRDEAASSLKESCEIEVQDKNYKTILPKMTIHGISKDYFDNLDISEIKKSILEKNINIQKLVEDEKKVLEVIFMNNEKDSNYCYAVIKVDEHVKNIIASQGMKLYIGLSSCRVSERYHITQCYACQQFGHRKGSDKCRLLNTDKTICLYCSGEHASKKCQNKGKPNFFKCNNCANSIDKIISSKCNGHTTTNPSCPVLQQTLKTVMNRTVGTSYRTNVPKNCIST